MLHLCLELGFKTIEELLESLTMNQLNKWMLYFGKWGWSKQINDLQHGYTRYCILSAFGGNNKNKVEDLTLFKKENKKKEMSDEEMIFFFKSKFGGL